MEKEKLNLLEQFGYSSELIKSIAEYPELEFVNPNQNENVLDNYASFKYSSSDMNEFKLIGRYNLGSQVGEDAHNKG